MNQLLDATILNLLETGYRYDRQINILKYRTWKFISDMLNSMGFSTPSEQRPWTEQSAAIYYRRHLRDKDGRLKACGQAQQN